MLKRMKLYWNQLFGEQQRTSHICTSFDSALENTTSNLHNKQNIAHSNALISNLKNDHQIIFNIFSEISNAIEIRAFENIDVILKQFKSCFRSHLIQENTQLYAYLKQHFAQQPKQLSIVQQVHQETKETAKSIFQFIQKWQDQQVSEHNLLQFSQEYKDIGHLLMQRIAQEENELYTLYPPHI